MTEHQALWVVYKMTLHGKAPGPNAVCPQEEWDIMEQSRPGYHTLIRAGIASEAEAEKLARSAPGGTVAEKPKLNPRTMKYA